MRVLLVLGRSTGGIGTHVGQLADDLRGLGHDVLVVTDASTAEHFGWTDARRWWPGGPTGVVTWRRRLTGVLEGADVIHAHGLQAGLAVAWALAGRRRRPRVVLSLHNPPPGGGGRGIRGRVASALGAVAVRRAELVTGASSDLVALAVRLGGRDARLAPVPSPLVPGLLAQPLPTAGQREAAAAALGLGAGAARPLLLTVARIAPQKRLDVVVSAARLLRERHDVVWAVAGGGDPLDLAVLEGEATGTGLVLLGARTDVATLVRAASLLVVSSDWEARALVVQEAMAAGTPVVATRVGGLPDLVEHTGRLVPPGDPAALAAAVEAVLDELRTDPARAATLVERARETARTWPDGEQTARQWVRWYQDPTA